jgi:hypothetical protein
MPVPTLLAHQGSDPEFLLHLSGLTPAQRLAAYRAGRFTHHHLTLWARHYPDEIPLINDELPWIAIGLADLD